MPHVKRPTTIAQGTFASVIRAYLASPQFSKLAQSTRRTYSECLRIAETENGLGGLSVETVRPALIQVFLDALSDTPGKARIARTALKAVERFAVVRDLLPYPITTGTAVEASDGGHEPWTLDQVDLAIAHASPELARVVILAVHLGQRGSDVVKMRWSDIEEHDGRPGINVVQKKTGVRLWIPFTAELVDIMSTWEKQPPFFLALGPGGQPWTRENLSVAWYRERTHNEALKPLRDRVLHGLRSTAIVRARKAGASPLEIASMYGMSPAMVTRYSRLAEQPEMALAVVHRLDRTTREQIAKEKQNVS